MEIYSRTSKFCSLLAAASLFAAACGSTVGSVESSGLDPNVGNPPDAANACLVGEPECNDTPQTNPDVTDLPVTPDDKPDLGQPDVTPEETDEPVEQIHKGNTVDGGLTVSEALVTDATGILAVKGQLFDDGAGMRLCEGLIGLGERYGCDGAQIPVANLDLNAAGDFLIFHEGTTFTETQITLFGEVVEGTLVLSRSVTS